MVTGMQLKQKDDAYTDMQMSASDVNSSLQKEEEGFYSSCGQAFIRIK
ncbi:hypothetical protein RE476_06925 [Methanolobus mangrovi]|uniref:Uncharacterized protein n=1 Tax=Methanolobus mangrovi TaxID=3072977 RepID=A0AA51UDP9_9EURY|nr:hypothetical protein [Methanolobus mangrovi]WMW21148.1 hypothetical protein RE476_06925 [Methanolobus mangrovi]